MSERMNLRWSMAEMGAKTGEIKIYSVISDYEGWDEKNPNATSQQFDKELKALVILRYFSGFSLREASELLEIPQGTAATRERRALRLLRLELKEEEQI